MLKKTPRKATFWLESIVTTIGELLNRPRTQPLVAQHVVDYYNRGWAKSRAGRKRAAIADYSRAIARDNRFVDAYINRANAKAELGRERAALADYDRAIAIDPRDAYAYYNRGSAKYKFGHKSEAMADFERASRLDSQLTVKIVKGLLDVV